MRVYSVFFKLFTFMYTYDIICRNLLTKSFNFNKEKIIFIINLKEGFFMLKKEILENADIYNKAHSVLHEAAKENMPKSFWQKLKQNYFILLILAPILLTIALIVMFATRSKLPNLIICGLLVVLYFMLFLTTDKSKIGLSSRWTNLGLCILWLFNFIIRLF